MTETRIETDTFGPIEVAADGAVTIDQPVEHAIIGVFVTGHRVELLDIPAPGRDGLTLGRRKRLHVGTGISLHKTAGGRVRSRSRDFGHGSRDGKWEELVPVTVGAEQLEGLSGTIQTQIITDPARQISIEFQPDGAKPMTVLAVVPRVEEVGG